MKDEGRRSKLRMISNISVQVKRGGVTQTNREALSRPARRSRLSGRRRLGAHLVGQRMVAFVSGLLIVSLYGLMILLLQKQPLLFSAYATVGLAGLAAFGMGLSVRVRASMMVMLPSMCSGHGRNFLLLVFVSLLMSGPLSNMLENTERAASCLLCGAELAANQTQQLKQKAATPLFSVLDYISRNVVELVVELVVNFIYAMTDSILHVAGKLFCVIPSYISSHLRKHLAALVIAVFQKIKLEFNISASLDFDLDANSSQSLHQMSQSIIAQISSALQVFQSGLLAYAGLILFTCSFLRAVQYRRKYLHDITFNNIYISGEFKDLDQRVTSIGGASVFPITRREAKTYITPLSFQLTDREWQEVRAGLVSVSMSMIVGSLLVALDFLLFWILDQVRHQVVVVARVPVTVAVQVNGSGYASDIYRDVVASFNILQQGNITVIRRKCLLELHQPHSSSLDFDLDANSSQSLHQMSQSIIAQ